MNLFTSFSATRRKAIVLAGLVSLLTASCAAVAGSRAPKSEPNFFDTKAGRSTHYLSRDAIQVATELSPPPIPGSVADQADFTDMLSRQNTRTAADCERANELVTRFGLAAFFGAPRGPLSAAQVAAFADLLDRHARKDFTFFTGEAKRHFNRNRPYDRDSRLHPCLPTERSLSYPSGHTSVAWGFGLILAEAYPAQAEAILARARQIGEDRVMGGVHHPSDVVAGRILAELVVSRLKRVPEFRDELAGIVGRGE